MADDDGATGEFGKRVFQGAQRLHIEVVGRFVQQQYVGLGLQHLGQVHPVALTARQLADLFLLIRPFEVEPGDIGAALHFALAQRDVVELAGDFLPHRCCIFQAVTGLVDVAELDRVAQAQLAAVRLFLAGDHAKQRRLAGAVGADDTDDAARR